MSAHPKEFTVKAWSANAIAFIDDKGLTREFSDWCGGWPCPVTPQMIAAAPALLEALDFMVNVSRSTPGFSAMAREQAERALSLAKGESA